MENKIETYTSLSSFRKLGIRMLLAVCAIKVGFEE